MLSQQIEEKKTDLDNAIANLKRVAVESSHNIAKERSNSALYRQNIESPERSKSIKDYSIMSSDRQSNGIDTESNGNDADSRGFEDKKFKSRYIDDSGAWTRESVDDGYVEFKDYIKDRREGVDFGISFNDKKFMPSRTNYEDISYNDEEYEPQNTDASQYTLNEHKDDESFRGQLTAGVTYGGLSPQQIFANYNYLAKKKKWIEANLGETVADKFFDYTINSYQKSGNKAREWNLKSDENNKADAYRHFIWNAQLTRDSDVGYYNARNITNRYEYEGLGEKGWVDFNKNPFNYLQDNTKIKCKMNQPILMDLWNNQVGRELANNSNFSYMTIDELFEFAIDYNLLITDANQVYDFLGISDYINEDGYYVNAEWDLTTGNIIFTKDDMWVELKIGV